MKGRSVFNGEAVKALGDRGVRGYLVRFTSPDEPDLYGDYFSPETHFGSLRSLDLYYDHGLNPTLKNIPIGLANLTIDDVGVFMDAQIEIADEYARDIDSRTKNALEEGIMEMVRMDKIRSSSGAARHLVEWEQQEKAWWIKNWPLCEASLTPRPAEPKNKIQTLKAFAALEPEVDLESVVAQALKSTGEGGRVEVHIHNHGPDSGPSKEEVMDPKNQNAAGLTSEEVKGLVADTVSEALKAHREAEEAAEKAAKERDDAINAEVEKRLEGERLKSFGGRRRGATVSHVNTKTKRGDSQDRAVEYWYRTGDMGAVSSLEDEDTEGFPKVKGGASIKLEPSDEAIRSGDWKSRIAFAKAALRASNAVDMEGGTNAEGGFAQATGHLDRIVARRDHSLLAPVLGLTMIEGSTLSISVPVDAETDTGIMPTTAEEGTYDKDSPALGQVTLTLVKKTKNTTVSEELLEDNNSSLLDFLEKYWGRSVARTHNSLLVTEVAADGTSLKTFNSATAIAAGEVQDILFNDSLSPYLEDIESIRWLTRPSTHGNVASLQGSPFIYGANTARDNSSPYRAPLLAYPVHYSNDVAAEGASAKSIMFGNWSYVYKYERPGLSIFRDPFTLSVSGQVRFLIRFRVDYEVALAPAIGYGVHPAS